MPFIIIVSLYYFLIGWLLEDFQWAFNIDFHDYNLLRFLSIVIGGMVMILTIVEGAISIYFINHEQK